MTTSEEMRRKLIRDAFRMPSAATMASRTSSITNAFVGAVIPVIVPTVEEIEQALEILCMSAEDVRCAYCGDKSTEWDHLRPLVQKRQSTGYISEIANLVPACGKCNQSKGNKDWRDWMQSNAKLSPTGRGVAGVEQRITCLEKYVNWKQPTRLDFAKVIGRDEWEQYWGLCEEINHDLKAAQKVADELRTRIGQAIVH